MKKHPLAYMLASIVSAGLIAWTGGQAASAQEWVALTKVGAPTWKLHDFQLFTAPASTQQEFFGASTRCCRWKDRPRTPMCRTNLRMMRSCRPGRRPVATSANRSFRRSDIVLQPNAVYFAYMLLPDPGITGSSRDFTSGPVIPNSLFPVTRNIDVFRNGVPSWIDWQGFDGPLNVRGGDAPFNGASHRANVTNVSAPGTTI